MPQSSSGNVPVECLKSDMVILVEKPLHSAADSSRDQMEPWRVPQKPRAFSSTDLNFPSHPIRTEIFPFSSFGRDMWRGKKIRTPALRAVFQKFERLSCDLAARSPNLVQNPGLACRTRLMLNTSDQQPSASVCGTSRPNALPASSFPPRQRVRILFY